MTDHANDARPASTRSGRLEIIDVSRGLALVAMAIYHFAWDLEFFGYAEPGMTAVGGWKIFARCIASSFLFLVGVSLVLAHAKRLRTGPYLKRLAMVAGAAALISLVTWFAVPGGFIFFGILHQIALASVLGLAFLRLPWLVTALVAAAVIAAPHFLRSALFDHPLLWWVGLSSSNPPSNDYVPLFPWFGAVLAGISAAGLAARKGLFERLSRFETGRFSRPLAFAGRHSLAVYLIPQPVLIAAVALFSLVAPAQWATPKGQFLSSCQASCEQSRNGAFCSVYCGCVLDRLEQENMLDAVFSGAQDETTRARLNEIAGLCTASTELGAPEEGE